MPGGSFTVSLAILSASAVLLFMNAAVSLSAATSICGAFGFLWIASARIAAAVELQAASARGITRAAVARRCGQTAPKR